LFWLCQAEAGMAEMSKRLHDKGITGNYGDNACARTPL